jgi:hypothetical protein
MFIKRIVIRIALWRLHRQIERLEERFINVRADMYRREMAR